MGQDQVFCPAVKAMSASPPRITGCSSRRYFTVIRWAYRGATCRNVLAINPGHTRFSRWAKSGAWKKIFEMLAADADNEYAMIDSTIVRTSSTAPALKKMKTRRSGAAGGLSTKIHAMVDALGNPLAFFDCRGQAHDLQGADELLPQMQADTLLADKTDADERVIEPLLAAGKSSSFRPRVIERFNASTTRNCTRARHLMGNFYCKLKQYRAIATRYDKTARNFLGAIHLAAAVIWLN